MIPGVDQPQVRAFVTRCQWCQPARYLHTEGSWKQSIPNGLKTDDCVFSDGICPECQSRQLAELRASRSYQP